MAEMEGPRQRKRSSVGAGGATGALLRTSQSGDEMRRRAGGVSSSGTLLRTSQLGEEMRRRAGAAGGPEAMLRTSQSGEEMRRTTRAASKRAAIDDAARVAHPASGVQQAKKRAAFANLSNHSSLPSSRSVSPGRETSEVDGGKRAALANLSNNANVPVTRKYAPGSKSVNLSQGGLGKSKPVSATLSSKKPAPVTRSFAAPVAKSGNLSEGGVGKQKPAAAVAATFSSLTRNYAAAGAKSGNFPEGEFLSKTEEVSQEKAGPASNVSPPALSPVEDQENVPPAIRKSDIDSEMKVGNFTVLPLPGSQKPAVQSNAAVIASLERKTLENLYISRNTKVLHQELGWSSSSQNYTDIDGDLADPQMCSIYAIDIYQHLRMQEVKRRPSTEFMESLQQDINASMRGILIDWLVEVAEEYKLVPDTLYLTVSYIDRFLSTNLVNRQRLQLLGVSCMLIAAKYEEICAPQVEEFCYITDNTYAREDVLEMERRVLSNLHFELTTPTTKSFLRRFIRAAQAGYAVPALQLEFLGNYLAELTLVEYNFLHYLPSLVAASAVFVAKLTLDSETSPWNTTLQHYSGYRSSELQDCVREIHELQLNSKNCTLPAIREKYSQHKFKCVATLTPSSKIPAEYFEDMEG